MKIKKSQTMVLLGIILIFVLFFTFCVDPLLLLRCIRNPELMFALCVQILHSLAETFNMTYEQINVLIFCFLWPILTVGLILWIWRLKKQLKFYKTRIV